MPHKDAKPGHLFQGIPLGPESQSAGRLIGQQIVSEAREAAEAREAQGHCPQCGSGEFTEYRADKAPGASRTHRKPIIAAGAAVVVAAAIVGGLWLWNGDESTSHADPNAVKACQNLRIALTEASGRAFVVASRLGQAAANDDATYQSFAGEIELANSRWQTVFYQGPNAPEGEWSAFTAAIDQLQDTCKTEMGVTLGRHRYG